MSALRNMLRKGSDEPVKEPAAGASVLSTATAPRVLNVGGGSRTIPIPSHYDGWQHLLLDIDPRDGPDIVCDARKLDTLAAEQFDAIYCSHNLEHYYLHDVHKVLRGFLHVLKPDGFAEIKVPDIATVMRHVVEHDMDVEDVLYVSPAGPIKVRDVLYGWQTEIERSGNDFYAHKNGFTWKSLMAILEQAGFAEGLAFAWPEAYELRALAFKAQPTEAQRKLLGI
jgi:SAM-dependent methyltransferase